MIVLVVAFVLALVSIILLHALALNHAMRETESLYALTWLMDEEAEA